MCLTVCHLFHVLLLLVLTEHHETRTRFRQLQFHRSILTLTGCIQWSNFASHRIPAFGSTFCTECHLTLEGLLLFRSDKVPISSFYLTVQPTHVALYIRLHAEHLQCFFQRNTTEQTTLADGSYLTLLSLAPNIVYSLVETLLGLFATLQAGQSLRSIRHYGCPFLNHLTDTFQCFRTHALVFRNPDETIRQAFRSHHQTILHTQAVQQHIRIAIIVFISFRERIFLIRLMADFITQIPQHIRYRTASFQQVAATCQVCGKFFHVRPPGLSSQERSTNLATHGSAWRQETDLWIVCIGMEHIMCNSFDEMIVRIIFQEFKMLVPMEVKSGKRFGSHTRFAIHTGSRGCRLDRFEVQGTYITCRIRMPELTHREISILEIFHDVCREHIARCCFVHHSQSLFVPQFCHATIELVGKQIADDCTPVEQETGSGFRIVYDITHQSRKPRTQFISRPFAELAFHLLRPSL